jgi:hypothetical protein
MDTMPKDKKPKDNEEEAATTNTTLKDNSKNAKWSHKDEATLVQTLKEQKANANWGDNNPKLSTYAACLLTLVGSENESGGGPKTLRVISSRWQRVRPVPHSTNY